MTGGGFAIGCVVAVTDAGSPLPPWNGSIEPIELVAGWRMADDLPDGGTARRSLLFPLSTRNGLLLHFPRRVEGTRVSTVGHYLQVTTGTYCGTPLPLYDVMTATTNRGVLGIGEWDQSFGVPTNGVDRRVRYFEQTTFSPVLDGGAWGGAVGAAAFQSSGSVEPLVLQNLMGRGQTSHRTGGVAQLPCELFPGPALVFADARDGGGDVMMAIGRCDGGMQVYSTTENGQLAQTNIIDAGTSFEFAAGRSDSSGPVLAVMRLTGTNASELELTRFTSVVSLSSTSRRITFAPQVTIKGLALDDFDQPLVLVGATPSLTAIDNNTGADAGVVSSSLLTVLQLDRSLNPVRLASISYPAILNSRSFASTGGVWVVDVECNTYDGGSGFPCPSTRSSFAMQLLLADGGAP